MFSFNNVERPCLLLSFRSQIAKKHRCCCVSARAWWKHIGWLWCLISVIVCSIKTPYKVMLRIVFVHLISQNPYMTLYLPLHLFALPKTARVWISCTTNPSEMKSAFAIRKGLGTANASRFVSVSVYPPLWCSMRTLIGLRPLFGNSNLRDLSM